MHSGLCLSLSFSDLLKLFKRDAMRTFARDIIHVDASDRTGKFGRTSSSHHPERDGVAQKGRQERSVRQFRARAKCCQAIFLASASEYRRFPSRSVLSVGAYRCVLAVGKYTLFHPPWKRTLRRPLRLVHHRVSPRTPRRLLAAPTTTVIIIRSSDRATRSLSSLSAAHLPFHPLLVSHDPPHSRRWTGVRTLCKGLCTRI